MTSIKTLLQSIKLTTQKNKGSVTYTEAFEEAGIETIEDIGENITTKEELVEFVNPKPLHLKKILKVLENKYNIKLESTKIKEPGSLEEKEGEKQSTFDKYPQRKSYKGIKGVKVLNKIPGQEDVTNGKPIKTILVVGQTGTGKTTCLNSMMNYLFDVDVEDKYRFKLIHENNEKFKKKEENHESMTDDVTAYYIEPVNPNIHYNLTLVDTPGFGDTRGIEQDKKIVKKIKTFFEKKLDSITGVCFVIKASETRLNASQKYIFSQLFSIFGKDIAENIFVLITFCDGGKPNALGALNAKDVQCPYTSYFKLNNSAFYNTEHDKMTKIFWDMGMDAFQDFFNQLGTTKDKSLKLTKQVLKQREKLICHVENLHFKIAQGTGKMRALSHLEDTLEKLAHIIDENKDFEYTSTEHYVEKISVPNGQYTTFCASHQRTCHKHCGIPNDNDKAGCAAMSGGVCRYCPSNCHWSNHHNYKYWLEPRTRTKTQNSKELFQKYGKASGEASQTDHFIEKIEEELAIIKVEVLKLIEEVTICNEKLKVQALRHNPVSQKDYVKLMIKSETDAKKEGFIERIKSLESLLHSLELIESIQSNKNNKSIDQIKLFDMNNSRQKRKHHSSKIKQSQQRAKDKADSNMINQFTKWCSESKKSLANKINQYIKE